MPIGNRRKANVEDINFSAEQGEEDDGRETYTFDSPSVAYYPSYWRHADVGTDSDELAVTIADSSRERGNFSVLNPNRSTFGLVEVNRKIYLPPVENLQTQVEETPAVIISEDIGDITEDVIAEEIAKSRPLKTDENWSLYFNDGVRKIDFVIVWKEPASFIKKAEEISSSLNGKDENQFLTPEEISTLKELEDYYHKEKMRKKYIKNLKKNLHIEEEKKKVEFNDEMQVLHFIKLHVPFSTLCDYAEKLALPVRLELAPNSIEAWSSGILKRLRLPNFMQQTLPCYPSRYCTCAFKYDKFHRYVGHEHKATFFSDTQRSKVVAEILGEALYGSRCRGQVGIEGLLDKDVFVASYPLHCGSYEVITDETGVINKGEKLNDLQVLDYYWARWGVWYKNQPLDHVRAYFGEQIGLYFAWLGFYTSWLIPASIVGLLVFMYGIFTVFSDPKGNEICGDVGKNVTMCPPCDNCNYWKLSKTCMYARVSYLFDHPGTVFFAIFMSFWAVFFLEFWKRTNSKMCYHWNCADFEKGDESVRPKYAALAPITQRNPITGVVEQIFPNRSRQPRILSAVVAISLMISLVLIFIIAVVLYRTLVTLALAQFEEIRSQVQLFANFSANIVNVILIMSMSVVYGGFAQKLTEWEMHRTQTEFENSLIIKGFLFQFFNFYASVIYIGFFKGKFTGAPGNYNSFLGLRPEDCANGSCLVELATGIIVFMVGKQTVNNAKELMIPKLKWYLQRFKVGGLAAVLEKEEDRLRKLQHAPRWEEDFDKVANEGLYEEYMEMVIQYGFVTIFVAAFPIAPIFALLNNLIEIRLDAQKFVRETRRPIAERAVDIGRWFSILEVLTKLAVFSNGLLIAFTSDFLPKILYQYDINWNLDGYVDHSLAWAPPLTTGKPCRYLDYRDRTGKPTLYFWKLLAIRFIFMVVFEHVVFGVQRAIDMAVPDVPGELRGKIKRENFLASRASRDDDDDDDVTTTVVIVDKDMTTD